MTLNKKSKEELNMLAQDQVDIQKDMAYKLRDKANNIMEELQAHAEYLGLFTSIDKSEITKGMIGFSASSVSFIAGLRDDVVYDSADMEQIRIKGIARNGVMEYSINPQECVNRMENIYLNNKKLDIVREENV